MTLLSVTNLDSLSGSIVVNMISWGFKCSFKWVLRLDNTKRHNINGDEEPVHSVIQGLALAPVKEKTTMECDECASIHLFFSLKYILTYILCNLCFVLFFLHFVTHTFLYTELYFTVHTVLFSDVQDVMLCVMYSLHLVSLAPEH